MSEITASKGAPVGGAVGGAAAGGRVQKGLAVAFLLVCAGMALHLVTTDPQMASAAADRSLPVVPRPMELTSSHQCQECHKEVYDEWKASHHAIAYTNPEVQRQSKGFTDRDCLPCHLPEPVYQEGIGVRVLARGDRHEEGVDCMTCHFYPQGNTMIGPHEVANLDARTAPCNPSQHDSISSISLCAACHNQHKVHDDWEQTRFAQQGPEYKDCNDCHMPEVKRKDGRMGRSHVYAGAHDEQMLRSAATLVVERLSDGRRLHIEVTNDGTGHNFPADERHRAVDLHVVVETPNGTQDLRIDRYRNPYRHEDEIKSPWRDANLKLIESRSYQLDVAGRPFASVAARRIPAAFNPERRHKFKHSTQIPAGEARHYEVTLPSDTTRATVRLWYRLTPYIPDHRSTLLHQHEVSFR